MHHIYRTEAFVINSFETKEADKDLILITNDFGLIKVRAQGIRKGTSKLKYALQDFSLAEIALVRGKNGYRLTNARVKNNFYFEAENKDVTKMISRVFSLVYKLVHGEEANSTLFSILEKFVMMSLKIETNKIKNLETLTVVNILHSLGYFEKNIELTYENLNKLEEKEILDLIKEINSSIKESQL